MFLDQDAWEFINSFAPWLSAIGTLAAVFVSLALARRTSRARLRLRSGMYHLISGGQRVKDSPLFFQLNVVNIGLRPVTISGLTWDIGWFKKRRFVTVPPTDPLSSKVPVRLDEGDEARYFFTEGEFKSGATEFVKILRRSAWPTLTVRSFKVGIYTTAGEHHLVKVDRTVRDVFVDMLRLAKSGGDEADVKQEYPLPGPSPITEYWSLQLGGKVEQAETMLRLQNFLASPNGILKMASPDRPVVWSTHDALFLSKGALDVATQLGMDTSVATKHSASSLPDDKMLVVGDQADWE